MNSKSIQIAICTCHRPQMLAECLKSIMKTRLPINDTVSVIVIDNAPDKSAESTVRQIAESVPIQVHYISEPRRGIPVARNKALSYARESNVDYLTFVDDDEQVSEAWLCTLMDYSAKKGGQAVIHGYVECLCPEDTPKHLAPFFIKNLRPTGTSMKTCATDNVLIPMQFVATHNLTFDETYPLAGGTDTLFFNVAHKLGLEIFSCAEAIVYETVPPSRVSLRWLSKRKYRIGASRATRGASASTINPIWYSAKRLGRIIYNINSSFVYFLCGKKTKSVQSWLKVCHSAGTIGGLMGIRYDEYKTIHGK